jgi:glycosyltransferase involved in cell wall biosynthesis
MPTDRKIIISVGSLIPRKGFDLLIRAIKRLSFSFEDPYLIIVGEGPARRDLETLISSLNLNDRICLVGAVPHQDLYLWYNAANISCLVSNREGWPNVVLESLACGTPVVATNIWGVPEIITSETLGLLTERTEDAIAEAILKALGKQWQTEDIVEYAKEYTWDNTAAGVLRVFRTLVNESSVFSDTFSSGRAVKHENVEGDGINI